MTKIFKSKKTITAAIAIVMTALIVFGGTFAWQSIQQEALNEVSAVRNPGGRLHDDFNDITEATGAKTMTFDKNVYVENFTKYAENGVQIFARVRLDEYMEFGVGAGDLNAADRDVTSLVSTATLDNRASWTTHIPNNENDPFHAYWNWTLSTQGAANEGKVDYMPTFNMNRDSLEADINGTFDADFTDYTAYTAGGTATKNEVKDADRNTEDELATWNIDVNDVIDGTKTLSEDYSSYVSVTEGTHTATTSLSAYVITMDEWLALPADQQVGNFWVWDNDGWAYWASPINPETATGVLLDGINRTETVINEDWYYAINVVAQFVTKDDLGKTNGTGFYDTKVAGNKAPSKNALVLLNAIGVDVDTAVADSDEAALRNALELGGNMTLSGTYTATDYSIKLNNNTVPMSFMWATGGSMTGGTLQPMSGSYATLFINTEVNYPNEGDGATAAIANNLTVDAGDNSSVGIYVQPISENVSLNNVTVTNNKGAGILGEHAGAKLNINSCTVTASTDGASKDWLNTAIACANGADVVVNGGTYTGKYAAYAYNTGGTITILDGEFHGELKVDAGSIVIKGGSFSVDPSAYVDLNTYSVEYDETTQMYEVK